MGVQASSYYDARAQNVDVTEITSSDDNAWILRRLRNNDPEFTDLSIRQHDYADRVDHYFIVQEGDDLEWLGYFIGRNTKLRNLFIHDMTEDRDREQIAVLFRGIERNRSIQYLYIYGGLGESLSTLLQSESCCLTSLSLRSIPFGDDVAVALADALKGNKSLKYLYFDTAALTSVGWLAFKRLLCDTSSVYNTYLSNHTLREIGSSFDITRSNYPQDVEQLLALNKLTDKYAVAIKILKYHPDFGIGPFLRDEWELKLLPLVMSWFVRARAISVVDVESKEEIEKRQLSTMYKFVRSMPLEAIDGYSRHSIHKKRKFDLLRRNFMRTLVLLCLLNLRLPTWGDFVASSLRLCVCLLQVMKLLLKEYLGNSTVG